MVKEFRCVVGYRINYSKWMGLNMQAGLRNTIMQALLSQGLWIWSFQCSCIIYKGQIAKISAQEIKGDFFKRFMGKEYWWPYLIS